MTSGRRRLQKLEVQLLGPKEDVPAKTDIYDQRIYFTVFFSLVIFYEYTYFLTLPLFSRGNKASVGEFPSC